MAKRVEQILERHGKLGDDLYALMPKQYRPDPAKGESWDPHKDIRTGDLIRGVWRWAICEVARCHDCLIDLTAMLMMKADDAKRNATPIEAVDNPDGLDNLEVNQGDPEAAEAEPADQAGSDGHRELGPIDTANRL
jgi:hypothetical protein